MGCYVCAEEKRILHEVASVGFSKRDPLMGGTDPTLLCSDHELWVDREIAAFLARRDSQLPEEDLGP